MALKITSRTPFGNGQVIETRRQDDTVEVCFTADPHGGPEALWFCFRATDPAPEAPAPQKLQLTLKHLRNLLGCGNPLTLKPVYQPDGQQWFRMKSGTPILEPDGQASVSWTIPYPAPTTEIAFCYPYGWNEIKTLMHKSKDYWHVDSIGLSQAGRDMRRLSNAYGKTAGTQPGLYLIARQHSGETPGSWVLDGMLQHLARTKKNPFLVWSVPLSNIDGISLGDYGKDNFPCDLNRAWGPAPMRHEVLVLQRDMQEWKQRCHPQLVLDFHAPGGSETDGIYAFLPDPEALPAAHKEAETWANIIREGLGQDYVADDFKRHANYPSRWDDKARIGNFTWEALGVPTLSLEVPYANCGQLLMQQKQYRDAGQRIAEAILRRKR